MVEVIKHGEKNIIDCNFCGAQLRYSVDDIKEQEKYLYQRDTYFEKYIVCPDCKINQLFYVRNGDENN